MTPFFELCFSKVNIPINRLIELIKNKISKKGGNHAWNNLEATEPEH